MASKDNIVIQHANLTLDSVSLGYTQGGVAISRPRSYAEIQMPGHTGISKKVKTEERVLITTELLESTLDRILSVWDSASLNAEDTPVTEHELIVTSKNITYTYSKVVSLEAGEHSYKRGEATVVPVTFEALLGPTPTGVEMGEAQINDGTDLGYCFDVTISQDRTYEDIRFPNSIGISGKKKTEARIFVSASIPQATLANIQRAWDSDQAVGILDSVVHEVALTITSPGITYSFAKAVAIDSGEHSYVRDSITVIPVRWEVLLGPDSAVAVVTLGGSDMPAQFKDSIAKPRRATYMPVFGGVKRSYADLETGDYLISFECPRCTAAQKNTIVALYEAQAAAAIAFVGHSYSGQVFFAVLDPPELHDNEWDLSGSLRVESS